MIKHFKQYKTATGLLAWAGIMPLVGSSVVSYWTLTHEAFFMDLSLPQIGLMWAVTWVLMCFSLLPTTFVALFYGYVFGLEKALPLVASAYLLAAWASYGLIRLFDHAQISQTLLSNPRTARAMHKLQRNSWGIIIAARISPLLPFSVMNVIFTVLQINILRFLAGSFIGMLPRTLLAIYVGAQATHLADALQNPHSSETWIRFTPLLLLGISTIVLSLYARKVLK